MTHAAALVPEFDDEMAITRRMLERVPSAQGAWRPHPKSFPLGHLAQLVAWLPGWVTSTLTQPSLDLAGWPGYSYEATETLLATFDDNVRDARAALLVTDDERFASTWSLKRGDQVLFTQRRDVLVRNHVSHIIHHRGQLSVYLRLLDVPVPSIYGPTADERAPLVM